jgi:SAM-dependent methyltransferase
MVGPQQSGVRPRPNGVMSVLGWIADVGFGHPRGVLGWLGGTIMARENRERNRWVVAQLGLCPDDRVLEIGFGPGTAIAEAARVARFVAGIDASPVMLDQARRRNAAAIQAGRVELRLGRAEALPLDDACFDTAFASNSAPLWADQPAGLRELRRVLRPGGLVATTWQPLKKSDDAGLRALGDELAGALRAAGFEGVRVVRGGPLKPAPIVCALGLNAAGPAPNGH